MKLDYESCTRSDYDIWMDSRVVLVLMLNLLVILQRKPSDAFLTSSLGAEMDVRKLITRITLLHICNGYPYQITYIWKEEHVSLLYLFSDQLHKDGINSYNTACIWLISADALRILTPYISALLGSHTANMLHLQWHIGSCITHQANIQVAVSVCAYMGRRMPANTPRDCCDSHIIDSTSCGLAIKQLQAPWDPGITIFHCSDISMLNKIAAWGQAEFQGEKDAMDRLVGLKDHALKNLLWPRRLATCYTKGTKWGRSRRRRPEQNPEASSARGESADSSYPSYPILLLLSCTDLDPSKPSRYSYASSYPISVCPIVELKIRFVTIGIGAKSSGSAGIDDCFSERRTMSFMEEYTAMSDEQRIRIQAQLDQILQMVERMNVSLDSTTESMRKLTATSTSSTPGAASSPSVKPDVVPSSTTTTSTAAATTPSTGDDSVTTALTTCSTFGRGRDVDVLTSMPTSPATDTPSSSSAPAGDVICTVSIATSELPHVTPTNCLMLGLDLMATIDQAAAAPILVTELPTDVPALAVSAQASSAKLGGIVDLTTHAPTKCLRKCTPQSVASDDDYIVLNFKCKAPRSVFEEGVSWSLCVLWLLPAKWVIRKPWPPPKSPIIISLEDKLRLAPWTSF